MKSVSIDIQKYTPIWGIHPRMIRYSYNGTKLDVYRQVPFLPWQWVAISFNEQMTLPLAVCVPNEAVKKGRQC